MAYDSTFKLIDDVLKLGVNLTEASTAKRYHSLLSHDRFLAL